jgi:hypothetical protein
LGFGGALDENSCGSQVGRLSESLVHTLLVVGFERHEGEEIERSRSLITKGDVTRGFEHKVFVAENAYATLSYLSILLQPDHEPVSQEGTSPVLRPCSAPWL